MGDYRKRSEIPAGTESLVSTAQDLFLQDSLDSAGIFYLEEENMYTPKVHTVDLTEHELADISIALEAYLERYIDDQKSDFIDVLRHIQPQNLDELMDETLEEWTEFKKGVDGQRRLINKIECVLKAGKI